ncbi:N,N'-diacetyllegionaminic acid synthase [subsurface metagenome]
MKRLVRRIRAAKDLLGTGEKILSQSEKGMTPLVRRSIVAARDLHAGTTLTEADVTRVRPGGGLSPGNGDAVLGKTLRGDLHEGDMVRIEHVGSAQ